MDHTTFESLLIAYCDLIKSRHDAKWARLDPIKVTTSRGKKFTKVIMDSSAHAFIENSTGDIYKPASWKAPAKHVRGNLANPDEALRGGYTVRYLS